MNLSKNSIDMLKLRKILVEDDVETTNINIQDLLTQLYHIRSYIWNSQNIRMTKDIANESLNTLDKVQELLQSLEFEITITERCPECDTETKISNNGGFCEHCGKWVKPCSMCDMDSVNCKKCPYECKDLIELENGDKFNIAEIETIYNKYVQNSVPNIDEYFKAKGQYTIKEFIADINAQNIELFVYENKVDLIQAYYVEDMGEKDLAQFIYNLSIGVANLQNIDDDPDIVVLNKDTSNEKFVWIKEY